MSGFQIQNKKFLDIFRKGLGSHEPVQEFTDFYACKICVKLCFLHHFKDWCVIETKGFTLKRKLFPCSKFSLVLKNIRNTIQIETETMNSLDSWSGLKILLLRTTRVNDSLQTPPTPRFINSDLNLCVISEGNETDLSLLNIDLLLTPMETCNTETSIVNVFLYEVHCLLHLHAVFTNEDILRCIDVFKWRL